MVEWWKGELLKREKKISLLVMFCQCTISFGKQKLYVKSGFQFSLKNFWRFLHLQNWYGTLQAKCQIYQAKHQRVKNYHIFIDGRPW